MIQANVTPNTTVNILRRLKIRSIRLSLDMFKELVGLVKGMTADWEGRKARVFLLHLCLTTLSDLFFGRLVYLLRTAAFI
jgi:hypothetical protein